MAAVENQKDQVAARTGNGDAHAVAKNNTVVEEETENIFLFVPNLIGELNPPSLGWWWCARAS